MAWSARTVENVNAGSDSSRVDLLPGEWAHLEIEYTSATTERMVARVFTTLETAPGVAELTTIPLLEFRLQPAEAIALIVPDVFAFVVSIDNDEGVQALTAEVRWRKSGVDLTA